MRLPSSCFINILIYSGLICERKDERSLFGVFPFSYLPISMNDWLWTRTVKSHNSLRSHYKNLIMDNKDRNEDACIATW